MVRLRPIPLKKIQFSMFEFATKIFVVSTFFILQAGFCSKQ